MTIYKIVYFIIFIQIFLCVLPIFPDFAIFFKDSIWFFIVPSFFTGCLAYRNQDLKVVLSYTTVSQMGFATAGLIFDDVLS